MKRRLLLFGLSATLVYSVLIGCMPVLDKLVLFPSTRPVESGDAIRKTIAFDRGELEMWTAASRAARAAGHADSYVLRFYGNADRPERWIASEAEMFPDRAVEVWGVNYPGFGSSTGPSRLARVGPAALAAFEEMKRTAGDRPILVSGTSFGTIAALHIAANRECAGVILHNPPALRQMIVREHGWWNLWLLAAPLAGRVPAALDSVANARAARAPAAFLLAERDEVVAPRFQRLIVEAYAGKKRIIPLAGAGHNTPLEPATIQSIGGATEWILTADPHQPVAADRRGWATVVRSRSDEGRNLCTL